MVLRPVWAAIVTVAEPVSPGQPGYVVAAWHPRNTFSYWGPEDFIHQSLPLEGRQSSSAPNKAVAEMLVLCHLVSMWNWFLLWGQGGVKQTSGQMEMLPASHFRLQF